MNIVCTGKPGDGLLRYSYEHCCHLNSIGIKCQVVIIPNPKHTKEDYIKAIKDQYKTYENIVFDHYTPTTTETTLIMGRSMLTLAYLDKHKYTKDQLLTLHLLFSNNVIALYSENQPKEYPLALEYFKTKKVYDLCDYEVYPNGVGTQYEKIINFEVYKPIKDDIQFKHLFLGTNEIYYKELEKVIDKYPDHGIITYNEKWINPKLNNLFAPISNVLGKFETYVYTKPNFDPAPRLFVEFRWLGKNVEYLRDKNIKDGGMIYWKRPVPTKQIYFDNINILVNLIKAIGVYGEKESKYAYEFIISSDSSNDGSHIRFGHLALNASSEKDAENKAEKLGMAYVNKINKQKSSVGRPGHFKLKDVSVYKEQFGANDE